MALDSRATRTTQPVPNIPRWTGDRIRRAGSPSPTMDEVVTKPGSTKIEGQRQALQNAQSARCCVNDGALLLCRWAGLSSLLRRQHDFNGGCRCQARGSAAVPIRAVYGGYTNQSGSGAPRAPRLGRLYATSQSDTTTVGGKACGLREDPNSRPWLWLSCPHTWWMPCKTCHPKNRANGAPLEAGTWHVGH